MSKCFDAKARSSPFLIAFQPICRAPLNLVPGKGAREPPVDTLIEQNFHETDSMSLSFDS